MNPNTSANTNAKIASNVQAASNSSGSYSSSGDWNKQKAQIQQQQPQLQQQQANLGMQQQSNLGMQQQQQFQQSNLGYGSSGQRQYSNLGFGSVNASSAVVQEVLLPTQIIEKPVAIHEEIRNERVEEIQPVVNIEKLKTEIHQVTQPLFDKEIKPVHLERGILASQQLPEVNLPGSGLRSMNEVSSVHMQDTSTLTVEKPAIYMETDKKQIIEEIQPVLYKETVIPTVIQETKPIYQRVVEGAVYMQETLPARNLNTTNYSYPQTQTVQQQTFTFQRCALCEQQPLQPLCVQCQQQQQGFNQQSLGQQQGYMNQQQQFQQPRGTTVVTKTVVTEEKMAPNQSNIQQRSLNSL